MIILIIIIGVIYNIKTINYIFQEVTGLYEHPYVIGNAVREININLVSMHRYMKDVALATDEQELQAAIKNINHNEDNVFQLLPVLHDKYLGKKNDILTFEQDFRHWKDIRQEVILLTNADNKGKSYIEKIISEKNNTLRLTLLLSVLAFLIVSGIYIYIFRDTGTREAKINRYFQMIDHNIFSLVFDSSGKIIESSSALAFFLKTTKKALHKQNINSLIKDKEQFFLMMTSLEDGFTWEDELHLENDVYLQLKVELAPGNKMGVLYTMILHDISDKKRIEMLSYIDSLTGLNNRRFFDDTVPKELQYLARVKENSVFMMIDIDHFKLYNDHYGHPEGDVTLKAVANELKKNLHRPHDYAFRLGGEEFGLFFSADSFDDVKQFLQNLIIDIENLHIYHAVSETSEFVTISAGAVYMKETKKISVDDIYVAADKLLYKAKNEGRNQLKIDVL